MNLLIKDLMNDLEVSIVNYLCPICGNIAEDGIIMNTLLTEKAAKEVKALHGETTGIADHACKECAKYKDKVLFCVGIDPDKCTKEDLYRTGQVVGIRPDCSLAIQSKQFIKTLKDGSKFCLIAEDVGVKLGLWK